MTAKLLIVSELCPNCDRFVTVYEIVDNLSQLLTKKCSQWYVYSERVIRVFGYNQSRGSVLPEVLRSGSIRIVSEIDANMAKIPSIVSKLCLNCDRFEII